MDDPAVFTLGALATLLALCVGTIVGALLRSGAVEEPPALAQPLLQPPPTIGRHVRRLMPWPNAADQRFMAQAVLYSAIAGLSLGALLALPGHLSTLFVVVLGALVTFPAWGAMHVYYQEVETSDLGKATFDAAVINVAGVAGYVAWCVGAIVVAITRDDD